ncbi:hypothetical protein IFM47457_03672 [Aspergillus lentulus]|nr:hypothetical protein IFM47457_03672 [Aspergillus lentulus]
MKTDDRACKYRTRAEVFNYIVIHGGMGATSIQHVPSEVSRAGWNRFRRMDYIGVYQPLQTKARERRTAEEGRYH